MFLENVNTLALVRASEAIVGPQVTAGIGQLYRIIDQAMKDGYELGTIDAQQGVEERLDAAFDAGFDSGHAFGYSDGYLEASGPEGRAYDEGYLDGVQDARARPAVADDNVQDIINLIMSEAFSQEFDGEAKENKSVEGADWDDRFWDDRPVFDISLVRDSGDENDGI